MCVRLWRERMGGGGRLSSQAQSKRLRRLAQLPRQCGQGSNGTNGRNHTASRRRWLRAPVTHCRYEPANQRPVQRSSRYASLPRCSSAPQSSASQARLHRPFNGSLGSETHLRHPFAPLPLFLVSSTTQLWIKWSPEELEWRGLAGTRL